MSIAQRRAITIAAIALCMTKLPGDIGAFFLGVAAIALAAVGCLR